MTMNKAQIFIGSSTEGLEIAQAIQLELQNDAICTIWYQGVFGLGKGNLQSLVDALSKFEFAILVLTPDDMAIVRGEQVQLPRDNVMFELGLFMGYLGQKCVYAVYCDDGLAKLPSDLAGVTLATFSRPSNGKRLNEYSTTDLLPYIGPAVHRIRSAIQAVQKEKSVQTTVHYIPPTLSFNEYLAELQVSLETEISKLDDVHWHFHPPRGNDPSNIYLELEQVMKIVAGNDLVILHARGIDNPNLLKKLRKTLNDNPQGKIVFVGQQPPSELLSHKRISFIGPDDRKVGILAAFALHDKLHEHRNADYFVLRGPGGALRSQGFTDGMKLFEPDKSVYVFKVDDVDRYRNHRKVKQIIAGCSEKTPVGIFASNDETALSVLRAIEEQGKEQVFVVGCDAATEMVRILDSGNPHVVATIEIPREGRAGSILQVIEEKVIEYQKPRLYPTNVPFKKLKSDQKFKEFWESSGKEENWG